jgi:hypothetical protein
MRLTRTMRPLTICLALVVSFGFVACSSSSDDKESGGSASGGGGTSAEAYCDALQTAVDLAEQSASGNPPADLQAQIVEVMTRALAAAPSEVRGDLLASFGGNQYAQEDLALYNEQECGYEYIPPPSTP